MDVLGDVDHGAAVFTAQCQSLQNAQRDEQDRCERAHRGVDGQEANAERRSAHDDDGDHEGALAPDEVAEPAEDDRPDRPHDKANPEGQQREDEAEGGVQAAEELRGKDARHRPVEREVVPLENRTECRGRHGADLQAGRLGRGHEAYG